MNDDKYPTLHALGLGPQLDAMERICAQGAAGKYEGESLITRSADHHFSKADSHMVLAGYGYMAKDKEDRKSVV